MTYSLYYIAADGYGRGVFDITIDEVLKRTQELLLSNCEITGIISTEEDN